MTRNLSGEEIFNATMCLSIVRATAVTRGFCPNPGAPKVAVVPGAGFFAARRSFRTLLAAAS